MKQRFVPVGRLAKVSQSASRALLALLMATPLAVLWCGPARSQADFQIVWVIIGEAAAGTANDPVSAGRHLFMADELARFSMQHVWVAKVEAQPMVVDLAIGEQFCVTSLAIGAYTAAGEPIKDAPLNISVRQDHKEALGLDRRRNDICVKAVSAGEFPLRFASMLPAKDGSTRGAQVFLRVRP